MTFFLSCIFLISDLDSNHVESFSFRFLIMCLRFYFYFCGFGWFVAGDWWNAEYFQTIPDNQLGQMNWVTTNFMQYNYCTDTLRYPIAPFECTAPYNSWIKIYRSSECKLDFNTLSSFKLSAANIIKYLHMNKQDEMSCRVLGMYTEVFSARL